MIKKAELHLHLESTITPRMATQLAKRNHITLPDNLVNPDGASYFSRDFIHFLSVYETLTSVIKQPIDYYDLTLDYLKNSALEGVIYTEMMYSPDHAENASGIPSIEHLHAIQQAINDAESQFDIIGRIIITAVRHYGIDSAIRVARHAISKTVPCVTGFGLAGDEAQYPPEWFIKAYQIANEAGLPCTVHAGEFAPHNKIIDAINTLPIKRIGHGVSAIYSQEARELIKARNIALEVCPSSNIFLKIFPDMAHHPFPVFLQEGLIISINSDDPPFMKTTIGQEYQRVQTAYQYSDETMLNITKMALQSAFVDDKTRELLLQKCVPSKEDSTH